MPSSSHFARLLCLVALTGACLSASNRAFSTTYYWDTNGASAGQGSATSPVNWLTNSWSISDTGTATVGPWPNTQPDNLDEAVFAGTAGTVRVNSDVYLNSLRFKTKDYQLQSTGGALHFVGSDPQIDVDLSSDNVTVTAPLTGTNGLTLLGNSQSNGLKFLVLANSDGNNPNSFSGTLTIAEGGALRLGGGVANEQIPDDIDLEVAGVVDFITSGGASDGKQEKVRDVTVTGALANFSIGNGSTFEVNAIAGSGTTGPGISVNGNNASVPGKLSITGWANGAGNLTLNNGLVRVNTTGATSAIGGRILLAGNIGSSGNSEVSNKNGGGGNPEFNNFTNRAFDFTNASHTIDVVEGTLMFTSVSVSRPLEVTSTHPGGTTLTKTGPGVWLWENATETSFAGTNRVEEGTWRLGANERLANDSQLEIAGGTLDLQGFSETVGGVRLAGGMINGTGSASLASVTDFHTEEGTISAALDGNVGLVKDTDGIVMLLGTNTYTGLTTVEEGVLLVNGAHTGGGTFDVASSGVLGGTGVIGSSLVVDGTISPGASVGTLIVGDTDFRDGSRFLVELTGSLADKLVADDISIASSASLRVVADNAFDFGTYVIGQYTTRSGEFLLDAPAGFSLEYNDLAGQILLDVLIPGDFNGDGFVNSADLDEWQADYGINGDSDADGDGDSDGDDFLIWQRNYGAGSSGIDALQAVPEPTCLSLAVFVAVALTSLSPIPIETRRSKVSFSS